MRSGAPWACRTTSSRRPGKPWWTASGTNCGGRGVPIQGSRESNGGKRRAVLLLSLILLVWNAFATAQQVVSVGLLPAVGLTNGSPILPSPEGNETGVLSAESPRSGPLTIRQKYLLGKRIDINKASLQEISELPGISDTIAAAVVE